ncbi:MAG: CPBP family intramembrane metalloprotease [Winogradskyella sp.]|uniref:CPBP family intramembrane glutamic endopeptidase n=1 Tax=Winogradskyella sp. TaxID=1883156 RepID=UPI0025EE8514|nr:type II CAAX endopeptidase family protein [Winogradskyella sp.]NRB58452.1 CPBP family intramembrane metalloprotease [Winogradskyella sp.]
MKSVFTKYPNTSKYILAVVLFFLALFVSGFIDTPFLKRYFPYVSIILLITVTWILFKTDNESLNVLGFNLSIRNLLFLPLGIIIGAVAFLLVKYLRALYTGEVFELTTSEINYNALLYGLYTLLPTVAIEEFLFRGYLFKKTIEVSNVVIANVVFGIIFMLVHILDRTILQNIPMIVFLGITIPIGHLLFATALLKSKTIYFPIGLHLGNNWATIHLISNLNDGSSIFFIPESVRFETWSSFITLIIIWNTFYVLIILLIGKWDKVSTFLGLNQLINMKK